MMEFLDMIIVAAIVATIIEFFICKIDKAMVLFATFKAFFYGGLALFIYLRTKEAGLDLSSPEDWLTLFTFILAAFEAAHNFTIFICSLRVGANDP